MNILITRAIDQAYNTQKKLSKFGYNCITAPVVKINYNDTDIIIKTNDILLFTSINAVKGFLKNHEACRNTCFAIGKKTSAYLRENGFLNVFCAGDTALDMAEEINKKYDLLSNKNVFLHYTTFMGKDTLEKNFNDKKSIYKKIIIYNVSIEKKYKNIIRQFIKSGDKTQQNIILLYSRLTARFFSDIIAGLNITDELNNMTALCFSKDVKTEVEKLPWKDIFVLSKPNEENVELLLGKFSTSHARQ